MGYFADELERRRAARRARFPVVAAFAETAERLFGRGVVVTGAIEGDQAYRPEAVAEAGVVDPRDAQLHALFTAAQAAERARLAPRSTRNQRQGLD